MNNHKTLVFLFRGKAHSLCGQHFRKQNMISLWHEISASQSKGGNSCQLFFAEGQDTRRLARAFLTEDAGPAFRLPCPSFASLSLTPLGRVPTVNEFLPNLWPSGLVLAAIFGEEVVMILVFQRITMKLVS